MIENQENMIKKIEVMTSYLEDIAHNTFIEKFGVEKIKRVTRIAQLMNQEKLDMINMNVSTSNTTETCPASSIIGGGNSWFE